MAASMVSEATPVRRRSVTLRTMTSSFVLHLQSGPLVDGEVRGVVEIVATGERRTVLSLEELGELLLASCPPRPPNEAG
jgi:hypothetical protein